MKNLHLLPTEKPSRLYEFGGELILTNEPAAAFRNQHIYITNSEEIKEGDWLYHRASNKLFKYDGQGLCVEVEKIILTTDQDLIEDGVQAIDDDFLEWFVKNPSCEEIPIVTTTVNGKSLYKTNIGFESWRKEEPKQETLEEVAEKILFYNTEELEIRYRGGKEKIIKSMIDMAKWQQERSYSEEEVIELLQKALTHKDNGETGNLITAQGEIRTANFYSWFEQFKKK
jgi:hypothetical protein